jgi:phospholipid/cholesterol/gamma-HCH transport system substrate-binding protein
VQSSLQSSSQRDLIVGAFVLLGIVALAYLSMQVGANNYVGAGGLRVTANFDEIGKLSKRAAVKISGVTVGRVTEISLDEDLRAHVMMEMDESLELPIDTSASIRTEGVLGNQYISLAPGAEEDFLVSGDAIDITESAVVLEKLIGAFLTDSNIGGE